VTEINIPSKETQEFLLSTLSRNALHPQYTSAQTTQ